MKFFPCSTPEALGKPMGKVAKGFFGRKMGPGTMVSLKGRSPELLGGGEVSEPNAQHRRIGMLVGRKVWNKPGVVRDIFANGMKTLILSPQKYVCQLADCSKLFSEALGLE